MVKKVEIKIEFDEGSISIDCKNPKGIFSTWDSEYWGRIVLFTVEQMRREEDAEAELRSVD